MGFHTFDVGRADSLENEGRYRYVSVDELLALFGPSSSDTVADLGSGTGFYTDDVAPYVNKIQAVDVQSEMHDYYRKKGAPTNVSFVTANVHDLPFADDALNGAFSTMTFHEFATEASLTEVARVLAPGARFGVADWSAKGRGEAGPPLEERFDLLTTESMAEAVGLDVTYGAERRETFVATLRI
jgi:ubiquinone/menaquinone biosynthesis C-methylase UbiE